MNAKVKALTENVESVFVGKPEVVERAVVCLLAGGHLLIEDVPGVGKTVLARSIARSVDGKFRRIQFTPDLLPSDILGVNIYNEREKCFEFNKGPVFSNIIVADEINRTTPRTQSSLLEAMSDRQVSLDGHTHELPDPFMVVATQNPYEYEGTYPLPENQFDRFMMTTRIGYPEPDDEKRIMDDQKIAHPIDSLQPVVTPEDVIGLVAEARAVGVTDAISDYIIRIVAATRSSDLIATGVSPRGSIQIYRAAQALALVRGRDYVEPDDVKELAPTVFAHRVRTRSPVHSRSSTETAEIVEDLVDTVEVPL